MRKVYQKLSHLWLLLIALLTVPVVAAAQDLSSGGDGGSTTIKYQEDFDYDEGDLLNQDKWTQYGINTAAPIQVVNKTLEYANYPGGVTGKCIQMTPTVSGQDLCTRFDSNDEGIKSGYVYYTALINVTKLPTQDAPSAQNYVMSLLVRTKKYNVGEADAGKYFSSTELGRLFIVKADDNSYKIGISRGSSTAVLAEGTFALNTTQLVVVKYGVKTSDGKDEVKLYVNPTDFTNEPKEASAEFDVSATGSSVGNYGLQGFELRQGSNASNQGPEMYVGALRIAQTYAGLFGESSGGDTPQPATPTISVNKNDTFLADTYVGYPVTKTITVKGADLVSDVTVAIEGTGVTADKTTLSKEEVESTEGAQLTFTFNPTEAGEGTVKVSYSSEGAETVEVNYSYNALSLTDVATLSELNAKSSDNYEVYRYTGEAVVSFIDNTANRIYVQDATAATVISNENLKMPNVGDKLSGFFGTVSSSWGVTTLTPESFMGQAAMGNVLSTNNEIEPTVATLAEVKATPKNYLNKLVRINGVTVTSDSETFAEGMTQPTLSDGTETAKMRIFKGTSLIGTAIPTEAIDLVGLSTSTGAVIIAPRSAEDIKTPEVVGNPELTITPAQFDMAAGKVGQTTEVGTIHISAKNMPAATTLEITGANRAMFATSVTEIKKGTSETDVVISYNPTAIGKHSARVFIDCPEVPTLSQSITLSAYAIDEQNPPVVKANVESVNFEAKAGETAEQTIVIQTANLPDYAYVKLASADVFRISSSMLMKNANTSVKISFVPLSAGTYDNELIVTTLGADELHIPIKGVATDNTTPDKPTEGDLLPLDPSNPTTLLNEHFDKGEKNKPIAIDGWKNIATKGTRAWWNYTFSDTDESAGEHVAKVTAYDSKVEDGDETETEMMLVTPALNFKDAASKVFTFRVRGDYLTDNQTDQLELCYIDLTDGEMYISPVGGFTMPSTKDESGEWFEYHVDLTDQPIADTFFMAFRFKSTRGRNNAATYYIDDVSFGRTDLPVVRTDVASLAFEAIKGQDATSDEVTVTTQNLTEPIKLTLGGANKSKFKLSESELPAEGGVFTVRFNSDAEGVHEAYVKLASRGAADKYVVLTVNNTLQTGIAGINVAPADITIFALNGVALKSGKAITPAEAIKGLPTGTYILQKTDANSIQRFKIAVK